MRDLAVKLSEKNSVDAEVVDDNSTSVQDLKKDLSIALVFGRDIDRQLADVSGEMEYRTIQLQNNVNQMIHANQNYWNADYGMRQIVGNEKAKHDNLLWQQNNLLNRINHDGIRLWRYKNYLYYRTNSNLHKGDKEKIELEISAHYGVNVRFVNDLNDALKIDYAIYADTTYIAINCLYSVEEEVINHKEQKEIFTDSACKRNLLAHTRYVKHRVDGYSEVSDVSKVLHNITKNGSFTIATWISHQNVKNDTMLVLVGNTNISEDIVIKKILVPLFSTEFVAVLSLEMVKKQDFKKLKNKLFLHINQIPTEEAEKVILRNLLVNIMINRVIPINNDRIPTQIKVIITIEEPDPFFNDFLNLTTVLFINRQEKFLEYSGVGIIKIYESIENGLNYFSGEIYSSAPHLLKPLENDNDRYLENTNKDTTQVLANNDNIPILDPYNNSCNNIISIENRFKHTYAIGNQGYGKSELIISLVSKDCLHNDCSVVLLDPHGDLAEDLLKVIEDNERLVYIDLYLDSSKMPTINLFDAVDNSSEESIYLAVQLIMSVLKNVNSEEKFNGLMENVIESCVSVMLREGGGSFWELYQFLDDKGSKDWVEIGKKSPNQIEADFFNNEFDTEKQTRAAARRRLSSILRDPKFSAFMNRESTLNLEELVNTKGKIIIFNIASGRMPNTYQYYMKFLVGYLQLIALKRVSIPIDERVNTQLYLDEFHLFLDKSRTLQEILTGARKYKMFLTFAHQTIAQVEKLNFQEIITTIPTRYFIGNIANKSVEVLNKALNEKLENPENLTPGQFYFKEDNNKLVKIQNTDRFIAVRKNVSHEHLQIKKQYQLEKYYRSVESETSPSASEPTEEEVSQMIQKFKSDIELVLSSQKTIESSCLKNVGKIDPKRLEEIKSDIEFYDAKSESKRPRIRQKELSTVFQLSYELAQLMFNRDFVQLMKSEDKNDMFNQTDSGTRSGSFTDEGKSKTEQYYYLDF